MNKQKDLTQKQIDQLLMRNCLSVMRDYARYRFTRNSKGEFFIDKKKVLTYKIDARLNGQDGLLAALNKRFHAIVNHEESGEESPKKPKKTPNDRVRATTYFEKAHLEALKATAWHQRRKIQDVMADALDGYFKTNNRLNNRTKNALQAHREYLERKWQ